MHTDQFNHHPGQLMMNTGSPLFGRPSVGSWLAYGLGSESKNLPSYVVLTAGRGSSGGASLWSSGFLPSNYQGVLFRDQGDPVLNLGNPPGITREMQHYGLDAINDLNRMRLSAVGDPEIASRIASSPNLPATASWRGDSSSAECASSTCTTPRGITTATSTTNSPTTQPWPTSRWPR